MSGAEAAKTMRTAKCIAKWLVLEIIFGERELMANDMRDLIAEALTNFRDEAVQEARNRALEESAKIAESGGACDCGCLPEDCPDECASKIRALKR